MNEYTTPIQQNQQFETEAEQGIIPVMVVPTHEILAVLSAITTATCIFPLSVWVSGTDISNFFTACTWGLGVALALMNLVTASPHRGLLSGPWPILA